MADNDLTGEQPDGAAPAAPEKTVSVQEGATGPLVEDRETVAPDAPDADGDDAPDPSPQSETRKPVEKLPDWAQKKMNELAAGEREARRRAKELEAELAKKAAPGASTPNAADEAAANANAPDGGYGSMAEFNAAVQAEADRRAQAEARQRDEAAFNAACNDVWEKGSSAYADDFKQAVANLQSVGVMNRDILDLVLATDDPAKVLLEMGSDPAKANDLMSLSPAKRAVEIAKLAGEGPKKPPEPLSKAPAPVRPVEGTARVGGEPRDDDDDQTWFQKRLAQRRERIRA